MAATLRHTYASTPVVTRGQPFHLGGDPKGKNFLYCCGNSVIIRSIDNPLDCDMYSEHTTTTSVAKYAPSGFYIASGDSAGNIRVWDTTQLEHPLKFEIKPLSGAIYDISWSVDNQRIVAVGEGREEFGAAFFWDSGASVGTISGHSKTLYSTDVKTTRPFRLATCGLDTTVCHFEGPPFRFKRSHKEHSRFANCVRFSPDGQFYISVGSDCKGIIYDGKTGDKVGELSATDAHKGGIYSVSWSPDSTQVLTASADKTAKVWDIPSGECKVTFAFGGDNPTVEHQQYACLWQGTNLITVSLAGDISYLDLENPAVPKRVVRGHNKFVVALTHDTSTNALYSAGYDGTIRGWDVGVGPQEAAFTGKGHTNSIPQLVALPADQTLVSCSLDDTLRFTSTESKAYGDDVVSLESQPQCIAANTTKLVVVGTLAGVVVVKDKQWTFTLPTAYKAMAIALSPDETEVIVGGDDKMLHVLSLENDVLVETSVVEGHRGAVTAVKYSPDGELVASCDTNREVIVFDRKGAVKCSGWVFHTARVTSLSWSPDGIHVATGSLDQSVIVWNVTEPTNRLVIRNAHQGGVNAVVFLDEATLATAGQDCAVKTWDVDYKKK